MTDRQRRRLVATLRKKERSLRTVLARMADLELRQDCLLLEIRTLYHQLNDEPASAWEEEAEVAQVLQASG